MTTATTVKALIRATVEQHAAILRLLEKAEDDTDVHIITPFDLPAGWLSMHITRHYRKSCTLVYGISPDGHVHS